MVKPIQKAEINSFVKGLITEASPLNFPVDAEKDGENFDLNKDGSRQRRLGVDFEEGFVLRSTGYNPSEFEDVATSSFKWVGANGDPSNEFGVIQFGAKLDFYDLTAAAITADGFLDSITLSINKGTTLSYAVISGLLIIASSTDVITIIEYDGTSFTSTTDRLLIRDLWGVPDLDNNDISTRPAALTDDHLYNLRNQGWGIPRKNLSGILVDPIKAYFDKYALYPANSEVVYTALQFQPVTAGTAFERIYPNLWEEQIGLNVKAAKGYYIIDALRRGTSRYSVDLENRSKYSQLNYAVGNLDSDITTGGASIIADFAGRVFYAGFSGTLLGGNDNSPNLSGYVLFSQVAKSKGDLVKCYQEGDPTSREGSDIVDTDGGFIRVSGAKKIIGMSSMANNLFIIADNGVWMVAGGSDFGFTATNYRIDKLSHFGCTAPNSIVTVSDKIFFWGEEGIFSISRNQYGDWVVNNLSEKTIQKYFDSIPSESRTAVSGNYDVFGKKIQWLFEDSGFKRELVFDTVLGSFSKVKIFNLASNSPEVINYLNTPPFNYSVVLEDVVVEGTAVEAALEPVVASIRMRTSSLLSAKFITIYSTVAGKVAYTLSQYKNGEFLDWFSADSIGVDAKAFILTGTVTAGDSSIYKQVPYLVTHFLKTESGVVNIGGELIPQNQSSCKIRSQWNWADTINSGNWSNLFQAYRYKRPLFIVDAEDEFDNGFETVVTKNKLRGRGRALSIYFETEPQKNCIILGWNLSLTGNNIA